MLVKQELRALEREKERREKEKEREKERREAERAKEVERQLGLARKYATVGWNLGNLCCLDTAKRNGE